RRSRCSRRNGCSRASWSSRASFSRSRFALVVFAKYWNTPATARTRTGKRIARTRQYPGSRTRRRLRGRRLMLINAGHPPQRQAQRHGELGTDLAQVVAVEAVLVDLDGQPRIAEFHPEPQRVADRFRQAAQLRAAAGDQHARDGGVAALHPEELEAAADLGRQFHQHRPQRFVDAARAELLALGVEVQQVLLVFGGDGGGAVLELHLFGAVEVESEGALDGGGEVVAADVDVAVHQDALPAHQRDGRGAGGDVERGAGLGRLGVGGAGGGRLGGVLAQQGARRRAQQRERLGVDDVRFEARLLEVLDLLRHLVEPGGGDHDLELSALLDVFRVVEHEVVEYDLVDGERDVALGFPLDRFIELGHRHARHVDVPRDRLTVADGRDGEAPADAGVVEQGLDLLGEAVRIRDLVLLDETRRHGPHRERPQTGRVAGAELHHLQRACPDLQPYGLDLGTEQA